MLRPDTGWITQVIRFNIQCGIPYQRSSIYRGEVRMRIPRTRKCKKRNPIGLHSTGLHQYPIVEVIDKAAEAGYEAAELNAETSPWAKLHVTPDLSFQKINHIHKKLRMPASLYLL
jgi:hypothetical protein